MKGAPAGARAPRLGRRLVPPGVLRRRHAARLRRSTSSAGSIRSPSRGRSCRAPADPAARRSGRWPLSRSTSSAAGTASSCCSRRRSTTATSIRATSRATCPGIRENGGQYTHGAIWSVLAFAALGDGDKAGELFSILNPINHASTRAGVHRYKVEPYVMAADVYAEPPHVGRGGWTWYTGSAGWMYQAGHRVRSSGSACAGTTPAIDPVHPPRLAGLRDRLPLPLRALRDRRREPARRQPRGRARPSSTATSSAAEGAAIPLADDGGTHRVRVVLG